jgi:transposase InsO family protein
MQDGKRLSLEQIKEFLEGSQEWQFEGQQREQIYEWVSGVLRQQGYAQQGRGAKGLLRRYLAKMSGMSRAQITRLIARYGEAGELKASDYRRHRFANKYTRADIVLLASVDEAHETLSGPATRQILRREYSEYGQAAYARLATISAAQIYRLRKATSYRQRRLKFSKTRPTAVAIGERRRPQPEGRPGYLRVDTVHQGDREGVKGVYHINAVDEVTQWQVVGCTAAISEAWLEPLLESMLQQFPFVIHGLHSDNGSEFVNHRVANLLSKLLIQQTKSRPRHSNDNGLVEAKNGAVIRKHIGYGHVAAPHAKRIQQFYQESFNAYLNLHRPCAQADVEVDAKGKQKRCYRRYQTPLETLLALPNPQQYLRRGVTLRSLREQARRQSDTQAAQQMQQAKRNLFLEMQRSA